jgi:Protein of unknown function (DUF3606)
MSNKVPGIAVDEDNFIDINNGWEMHFWMNYLGLSAKTLVRAVSIVGPDARKVRKWMRKNNPKKKPSIWRRILAFCHISRNSV